MASRTMSWTRASGISTSSESVCSEPRFLKASPTVSLDVDMVRPGRGGIFRSIPFIKATELVNEVGEGALRIAHES